MAADSEWQSQGPDNTNRRVSGTCARRSPHLGIEPRRDAASRRGHSIEHAQRALLLFRTNFHPSRTTESQYRRPHRRISQSHIRMRASTPWQRSPSKRRIKKRPTNSSVARRDKLNPPRLPRRVVPAISHILWQVVAIYDIWE